ncbi:hypothetical protein ACHAWF_006966 [Thalassiosira exigua]
MVELFGGAISAAIPSTWRDVSQVRQVPDHQEVYQDAIEATGAVLVVELLDYRRDVSNEGACAFFLDDLGEANGVPRENQHMHPGGRVMGLRGKDGKPSLFSHLSLPPEERAVACLGRGSQMVSKGKASLSKDQHWVDVDVCVLRLEHVETDVLITLSVPRKEEGKFGEGETSSVFEEILTSFDVRNWSLFG